jgi:hypothetical protein
VTYSWFKLSGTETLSSFWKVPMSPTERADYGAHEAVRGNLLLPRSLVRR